MRKVATFAALVMLGALALGTVAFAHGDDRGGGKRMKRVIVVASTKRSTKLQSG
jgi:hypothetical protein